MTLPPELTKRIEERAKKERRFPEKYHDGAAQYQTLMFYEVNDEREDAAINCATDIATELLAEIANSNKFAQDQEDRIAELTELLRECEKALEFYDGVHRLNWAIDFDDLPKVAIEALTKLRERLDDGNG